MSTTLNPAREAIYQAFSTAWGATTPVAFDNEKFDPPSNAPWVRLVVRHLVRQQNSMGGVGSRRWRSNGLVFVQVFVPLNTGIRSSDSLAQTVRTTLEGIQLSGPVWFNDALVREVGESDGWFQTNVEAEFVYDEVK